MGPVAESTAFDRRVRVAVYDHFLSAGTAPSANDIATRLQTTTDAIRAAWDRLAAAHMLVLQSTGALAMAMPFSAVPTPFRVSTPRGTWWANCAWYALGIPVMLSSPAEIDTTCGDCGTPLRIETTAHDLVPNTGVIHFAVPARDWWADIGFT